MVLPSPGAKMFTPYCNQRAAVDFREFHFQQNFLRAFGTEGQHVDDILRIGFGDLAGALGDRLVRNVARKHDGRARRGDGDLLVGEDVLLFLGGGGDVDIHPQIETTGALEFVPDEQGNFARGATVDENLRGRDDIDVSDGWIGHGNALEAFAGVDEQRLADHDAQRSGAGGFVRAGQRGLRRMFDLCGRLLIGLLLRRWRRRGGRILLASVGPPHGTEQEGSGKSTTDRRSRHHRAIPRGSGRPWRLCREKEIHFLVGALIWKLGFVFLVAANHFDFVTRRWWKSLGLRRLDYFQSRHRSGRELVAVKGADPCADRDRRFWCRPGCAAPVECDLASWRA